jgi:cation diffusion facilitator family transporter
MLSQGLQGLSDLITAGILFVGVRRSKRKADHMYHFGYGREVFFWVLMAGILMFLGTGGLSLYFGWQQFVDPNPVENIWLAFIMLTFGLCTNGYAFSLSLRRLHMLRPGVSWWHQLLSSSVVETKATFLIDLLGTSAVLLGIIALGTYVVTGSPSFDGLGSVAIGLSMMLVATLLIRDVRDLIVGKAVEPEVIKRIIGAAQSVHSVRSVLDIRTMYLGSERILVILEIHVMDGIETDEIEMIVDKVKEVVQQNVPEAHHIQVEIETPDHEIARRLKK